MIEQQRCTANCCYLNISTVYTIFYSKQKAFTLTDILQGIIVSGVAHYLQSWTIEKKGPVFLTMSMPLTLVITIILSTILLGEAICLGRSLQFPIHHSNQHDSYSSTLIPLFLQCLRWNTFGWGPLQCSLGEEDGGTTQQKRSKQWG